MDLLRKVSIIKKYSPGELISDRDTPSTHMFIILEGMLSLHLCDERTHKLVAKKTLVKGSFFGGLGLTDCLYRYIKVKAEAPSLLMVIPLKHVEEQRNYDRVNGEALYQNLLEKAEVFNDDVRVMELDEIKRRYKKGTGEKHKFLFDTPYQDIVIPVSSQRYLLKKSMKCPVCREKFDADIVRTSRLMLKKRGTYFINEYKDIEPLWLDIVVCPSCYYAERLQSFEELAIKDIEKLYRLLLDIKSSSMFSYSEQRTAEEVINAYLIYEKCLYNKEVTLKEKAKAAILMAELYSRMDSPGLADVYYEKAFSLYSELIDAGVVDVDELQMQQLYIILGKLYERKDMVDQAKIQYKNAKVMFGVIDKRYTNIADSYLINLTYDKSQ